VPARISKVGQIKTNNWFSEIKFGVFIKSWLRSLTDAMITDWALKRYSLNCFLVKQRVAVLGLFYQKINSAEMVHD
jgi:hypothetical protein